jgi:hypothetical protein
MQMLTSPMDNTCQCDSGNSFRYITHDCQHSHTRRFKPSICNRYCTCTVCSSFLLKPRVKEPATGSAGNNQANMAAMLDLVSPAVWGTCCMYCIAPSLLSSSSVLPFTPTSTLPWMCAPPARMALQSSSDALDLPLCPASVQPHREVPPSQCDSQSVSQLASQSVCL